MIGRVGLSRRGRVFLTTLALLCAWGPTSGDPIAAGQTRATPPEPTGTAALTGVVITDATPGAPVHRAVITLADGGLRVPRQLLSGEDGRFVFEGLPPGRFTLSVAKAGYVTSYYGSPRPWRSVGRGVDFAAGETRDITLILQRGSVVTGRVVDPTGAPMPGIRVVAQERRRFTGTDAVGRGTQAAPQPTDDQGRYRIFGLPPGEYTVAAVVSPTEYAAAAMTAEVVRWAESMIQRSAGRLGGAPADPPPAGPTTGYAPTYFPGVADPDAATVITLRSAEVRDDVDISLTAVPMSRVSGRLLSPDGLPRPDVSVRLRARTARPFDAAASEFSGQDSGPRSGEFVFRAVPPGRYVLLAETHPGVPPPGPVDNAASPPVTLWAQLELTVTGQDLDGLTLRLQEGVHVSGSVVFEGEPGDAAALPQAMLSLAAADDYAIAFARGQSTMASDGQFGTPGAPPGRYRFTANTIVSGGARWVPMSAAWRGRDLLDEGLELRPGEDVRDVVVTYSRRAAVLTGLVTDGVGQPVTDLSVVVFSADRRFWQPDSRRVRRPLRPAASGRYRIADLLPGEYFLAALADYDLEDLDNPGFLGQIAAGAVRVAIAAGETVQQDLRVVR